MTPKKLVRCALYARVSTLDKGQDTETQLRELREYAHRAGMGAIEYVDKGISGAKADRPALNRLMKDAHQRKFDAVICWKFDRFARSVSHLVTALDTFNSLNIRFVSVTEGLDTDTPMGRCMFTIIGSMAELERSLIIERTRAGLANARAKGHFPGPKKMQLNMDEVRTRRANGESLRAIATELGCSPALLVKRTKQTEVSHA